MPSILERMRGLFARKPATKQPAPDQGRGRSRSEHFARVDAAQTTDENKNHWAMADGMDADSAYNPAVRNVVRNRSRYETLNNSYAKGAVRSGADDLIGTGPRIQLIIPGDDKGAAARAIERSWLAWANVTLLPIALRTAEKSLLRDGGCFGVFDFNEEHDHPVKLHVRWMEEEQCTSPFRSVNDPMMVDGIRYNRLGIPVMYYFLKYHPGSTLPSTVAPLEYYQVPARNVVHWFQSDRHGQHRALPDTTPALPLYSQLRRYTLATLTAAEFAAMIAGIMKTNVAPEDGGEVTTVSAYQMFEVVRGALMSLPHQWDAMQMKSEQPTTTYPEFKRELLNESGRATNQPLNVVTGNSSGYNYSSGRLDHVPYHRGLRIKRNDLRLMVLDPIFFRAWLPEAQVRRVIPQGLADVSEWRWSWTWDGFDSIDSVKDAQADDIRIKNGSTTYKDIYAEQGKDFEEAFAQLAVEMAKAKELGLPWPPVAASAPTQSPTGAGTTPSDQQRKEDGQDPPEDTPAAWHRNGYAHLNGKGGHG